MNTLPRFYKDQEVAQILGVGLPIVRHWRRTGQLGFYRINRTGNQTGRGVRISQEQLDSFLSVHRIPA